MLLRIPNWLGSFVVVSCEESQTAQSFPDHGSPVHVEYPDPEIHTLKNLNTFGCESLTAEPSQKTKKQKRENS